MILAEIANAPTSAAIGCIAVVPVAIWIVSAISWMIMGDMDPLIGIPSILVSVLLGFVAMDPPSPALSPLALASSFGMVIVYPIVRRQMERREAIRFQLDQIDRAYSMIRERPTHAYPRFKLAEALYVRGYIAQAHAIAARALQDMPKGIFQEEHLSVQRWITAPAGASQTKCLKCGANNGFEEVFCKSCGADFLADYAKGKWMGSHLAVRLVAAWVMAVVSLVGVPYVRASSFTPQSSGTLIVVQLALCVWLMWVAFVKKERQSR